MPPKLSEIPDNRIMFFNYSQQKMDDLKIAQKIRFALDRLGEEETYPSSARKRDWIGEVDVSENCFGKEALEKLVAMVADSNNAGMCERFNISSNPKLQGDTVACLAPLFQRSSITELRLANLQGWDATAWVSLASLLGAPRYPKENLALLYFTQNFAIDSTIFVQIMVALKSHTALHTLDFQACNLTPDVAESVIHPVNTLQDALGSLRTLHLSDNPIGDGLVALFKWLPKGITELHLRNTGINATNSPAIFKELKAYKGLQYLDISDNPGINMLALGAHLLHAENLPIIKTLKLKNCSPAADKNTRFTALMEMGSLLKVEVLDISAHLTPDDWAVLCACVIAKSRCLRHLSMNANHLFPEHIGLFARAVELNPHNVLEIIDSNNNDSSEGCDFWVRVMKSTKLHTLSLRNNAIVQYGGDLLLNGLNVCSRMHFLNLDGASMTPPIGNRIQYETLQAIITLLKSRREEAEKIRVEAIRAKKESVIDYNRPPEMPCPIPFFSPIFRNPFAPSEESSQGTLRPLRFARPVPPKYGNNDTKSLVVIGSVPRF